MDTFITFLGRFHPLVVHLPIGILMLGFLMELVSGFKKYKMLESAIPFTLLMGSLSAIVAVAFGYLLSLKGDYDESLLWWHQWLGIGVAGLGFICYFLKIKASKRVALGSQALLMLMLSLTGHYGGQLTHGANYLTEFAPWNETPTTLPPPTSIDSAFVFQHLIQPILEKKCVSCHNAGKRKGDLRMDTPEQLLKGGEHGPVLLAGNLGKSELYRRITLPEEAEEFMPPDGKTPLTEEEIKLIAWWIEKTGHSFENRVGEEGALSEDVHEIIADKLNIGERLLASSGLSPLISAEKINHLSKLGIIVRPLSGNYEKIDVTLRKIPKNVNLSNHERLLLLEDIQSKIIWLNLSNQNIQDEDLSLLKPLTNLQRLRLDNNPISNAGVQSLALLHDLESLNLYGTDVNQEVLASLSTFPSLKKIYLWKTAINKADIEAFEAQTTDKQLIFGATN